jgi:hypothetical protein
MQDYLDNEDISPTKQAIHGTPLKMGIVAIIMIPLSFYFFYDRVYLFAYSFFIGSPLLAIFGLIQIKSLKEQNPTFNKIQLKMLGFAKIICVISICVSLIFLSLFVLFHVMVTATH